MTLRGELQTLIDNFGLPAVLSELSSYCEREGTRCLSFGNETAGGAYMRISGKLFNLNRDASTADRFDPST